MPDSTIVIRNATILTLDDNDNFYYPGTVVIKDDKIHSLHHGEIDVETSNEGDVAIIDGTDHLVMPGLIDLHFHTSVAKVREHSNLRDLGKT